MQLDFHIACILNRPRPDDSRDCLISTDLVLDLIDLIFKFNMGLKRLGHHQYLVSILCRVCAPE